MFHDYLTQFCDYSYTVNDVYNNFPWPEVTQEQKEKIEQTVQAILNARALYPDSSLADLYDELTMPPKLRTAHQKNDMAVMRAYGFQIIGEDGKKRWLNEAECVAALMKMYQKLIFGVNRSPILGEYNLCIYRTNKDLGVSV